MVVTSLLLRVWPAQVATKDESVTQVWERVRGPLRQALRTLGISSVPTARRSELAALDQIINRDVPELRWAEGLRVGMEGTRNSALLPCTSGAAGLPRPRLASCWVLRSSLTLLQMLLPSNR